MCSIGASSNQSLAAASTMSTGLGGTAIGSGSGPGARRVAGGLSRGAPTVLGGAGATPGAPGNGGSGGGGGGGGRYNPRTILAEY